MKTSGAGEPILVLALQRLFALCGLSPSPRRKVTPPPIFLCMENQTSTILKEAVKVQHSEAKSVPSSPVLPFPVLADAVSLKTFQNASGLLSRALNWIQARRLGRSGAKRLHVSESVSLGEKRFVAVIQLDGLQYLIGGGATNVALLAQLNATESFGNLLKETMTSSRNQNAVQTTEQLREQA